jgi:hypothetical protein
MDSSSSLALTQVGSSLLAVGGMQVFKKIKWIPLLQEGKKTLNRIMSIVIAGCIALGIHYVWAPNIGPDGGHILTITIPNTAQLLTGAFHWASQFIYQETGYTALQGLQSVTVLASTLSSFLDKTGLNPAVKVGTRGGQNAQDVQQ